MIGIRCSLAKFAELTGQTDTKMVFYTLVNVRQFFLGILLAKISRGIWVCLTPDMELQVHNLGEQEHQILDRRAAFPAWARGMLYCFDEDPVDEPPCESTSVEHAHRPPSWEPRIRKTCLSQVSK